MASSAPFLGLIPADLREALVAGARVERHRAGACLFDTQRPYAGVVQQGAVRVLSYGAAATHASAEQIVVSGDLLGVSTALGAAGSEVAIAVTDTQVLRFGSLFAEMLARPDPALLRAIAQHVHSKYRSQAMARVPASRRTAMRQSIAHAVLTLADDGAASSTTVRATHELIAEMVGSSREVVTRHLGVLARRGLVRQVGPGVLLIDQAELARIERMF
ncbi:MAG TPA: Crp/Fnr family transcriptional regulator [Candidatus Limnocylindria bacterium]|nr:Crp/Fnr family transcriptional regulator [Candidatus Limnocylindria bacterium]